LFGAGLLAMLAFVLHHLGDPLEVEFVNREVSELIITPCFWGPQMAPSIYSPTEARRSASFRYDNGEGRHSPATRTYSREEKIRGLPRPRSRQELVCRDGGMN
jgi:hypothetical protein